jgi:MHS family shikimate/dehydroshikimate transporter-like MFS transporter
VRWHEHCGELTGEDAEPSVASTGLGQQAGRPDMTVVDLADTEAELQAVRMRRVVFASIIGSMIEWYDFTVYGTATALVFNKIFFPSLSPLMGTLVAVSSYGVGFLARPLGGAIFGHLGDRLGRKKTLVATVILMGVGTFLIGCLPTYEQVGVIAPILLILLRLLQGVGIGGEWGGAVLLMVENAHPKRRGLFGSLVQIGAPFGVLMSILVFNIVSSNLSNDAFLSWGWRLPFLLSLLLVFVGLWIRLKITETPVFERFKGVVKAERAPIVEVITQHPRMVITAIALKVSEISWAIIGSVFSIAYVTEKLHLPRGTALEAVQIAALVQIVLTPLYGWMSDRLGRKPMYIGACLFSLAYAFPVFWLMDLSTSTAITVAVALAVGVGQGVMFGVGATYMSELFHTGIRYTGASLGFQIGAALSGGFTPIIAASLFSATGNATWAISLYLIALALITLIATLTAPETAHKPLD